MSMPVKYCWLVRAADDPAEFVKLHPIMQRNIRGGHFSIWKCQCDPHCRELSEAECSDLMRRFKEPLNA